MVSVGTIIGDRYEIVEKVGSGGMADVFRAKCHRLNRFVAIKILKQEYSEDTKFVTKFRGEAQAVACMSHPNIVSIYDVGEENGMYYIVMELIDGITLKKYIEEKGKLSVKEAVGISLQIANGLDAAHRNNIIHRDIKPQNILIARDGTAKVTDFGIAKAASSNTITANAMGSVHYISPEQARGGYSDEKSDIYSLGVTMYEMLSGTLPFTGESAVAIALAHIQEDATPLAALDGTIPKGLSNIVNKCMQKKTELRYVSAADLIADLKMFLQDPSGDYGVIASLYGNGGTIFMSKDDVNTLKNASRNGMTPVEDYAAPEEELEEEEESKSDVDPKLEKALVIGSIAVAIIIGLVVIYMLGRFIGFWGAASGDENSGDNTEVTATASPGAANDGEYVLPDFSDQSKGYVEVELGNENIKCKFEEEASDDIAEGNVTRTDPAAGTAVAEGATVTVYVSTGVEQISVPETSGKTITDAITELQEQGFSVKQGEDVYSSVDIGKVAYTKPAAGKKADKGATITIYPSKGQETKYTTVPNLIGMTRSQAKSALQKAGLKYGNETKNYSSTQKNRVCVQSVAYGKQVEEGTSIDVTLSLGEEETYTYKASVTVSNPFEYETDPVAEFKFVLSQDGEADQTVKTATMSYHNFPFTLELEGKSTKAGTLSVYRDGSLVASYNVPFKRVSG